MSDKSKPTDQTSTAQALYDKAAGTLQSAYHAVVGNPAAQAEGDKRQEKAQAEYDASHATVKLPGHSVSSSGAVTKDHPDRAAGSWNQTVGSAKEAVGGLLGHEGLKESGREQNLAGQEQEAKGQLSDFTSGLADRATGAVGAAVAGLTGDKVKEAEYQKLHAKGKTQERGAEHDIQKQAEARQ